MNYNPIKFISEQLYNHLTTAVKLNENIQNHFSKETNKCCFWVNVRDLLNSNKKYDTPSRNQIRWKQFTNKIHIYVVYIF